MSRISALFVLLVIVGAHAGHDGKKQGGKGHGGKGHGGKGHGGMGGPMGMMGLGKGADAVMCKTENLSDDKFDHFRTEVEACGIDECAAQADDISAIQKSENKVIARIHCSEKYKTCLKQKFHKGKGEEGQEPDEDAKKEWKQKFEAKKDCIKAAFEKVFGPIA